MADAALIGPWVRRFLLEHLVSERNLSINTQRSYRDMLLQLLPFLATHARKPIERLTVNDLSQSGCGYFSISSSWPVTAVPGPAISASARFTLWRDLSRNTRLSTSSGARKCG